MDKSTDQGKVRSIGDRPRRSRKPKPNGQSDLAGLPDPAPTTRSARLRIPSFDVAQARFGIPSIKRVKVPGAPVRRDMIEVTIQIPLTSQELWRRMKGVEGETCSAKIEPFQGSILPDEEESET